MSSQGHSKDPGKPHEKDHGREESKASPTKWRNPTTSGSPGAGSPTNVAPSLNKPHSPGHYSGKVAQNFRKLFTHPFGKEDKQQQPQGVPLPLKTVTPELDLVDIDHSPLAGAIVEPLLVNGVPILPNGGNLHSNDGVPNSDNSDNYSDHDSGSSVGGLNEESGRNSSQSPNGDSCSLQTHISSLPENVLENIFSFLELNDIRNVSMVCHEWNRVVGDENNEVWRTQCFKRMSREVVYSELLSSCPTFKAKLRAHIHSWNPLDCSRNIYVKPNGFTIHRNPVAQSTDGARGKIGFNRGRHAWEIVWEGPLGTVAVVGVATQQAEVRAQGYIALLGKDDQSWGWNLVENLLLHNGDSQGNYPVINNAPRYQVGERIRVILDCEDNTLSFEKNFEFLGVAFRGLPNRERLFPAVSAVYGNTEISMVYLGPPLDG